MNFKKIKAVIFDFDGVFTDNRVIISENGEESVVCSRLDGIGLEMLRGLGIPMTIISKERNRVVLIRARKLKVPVKYGIDDKLKELKKFSASLKIDLNCIAFVGNDINDIDCMKAVGFPIAVFDSVEDVKKVSKYVLSKKGGEGAVRELCELIFKAFEND